MKKLINVRVGHALYLGLDGPVTVTTDTLTIPDSPPEPRITVEGREGFIIAAGLPARVLVNASARQGTELDEPAPPDGPEVITPSEDTENGIPETPQAPRPDPSDSPLSWIARLLGDSHENATAMLSDAAPDLLGGPYSEQWGKALAAFEIPAIDEGSAASLDEVAASVEQEATDA